ncbi:MAG TPA: flagellar filament capping protein FliD [Gallionella sp.]|nr:flagellar filament capping protein FliD [Gallionella sp.]
MATSSVTSTSNIDVNSIVSQLMVVERQPLNKLDAKEASYQAKLSAYGRVKGTVSDFQTALQGLNSTSKFQVLTATPSDATVLSASASSIAVAGTYSVEVSSLAQAQRLVAAGQTNSTAAIGTGTATTVTFDFGTINGGSFDTGTGLYSGAAFTSNGSGAQSISIDSSNNSLQGIRDAINAAGIGVTATIVNDGGETPYRLALASGSNGASGSMKITVSGDAAVDALLAHDPAGTQNLSETVTAQNANFKVNGIAISKTSNTVGDVVPGVTLNLNKVSASPVTLTVARDTSAISSSIKSFVAAYNDLTGTLTSLSAYDATSQKGAILQGDATVRSLQTQLRNMLNTAVVGSSGALTTLSDVGIAFQKDGTLAINQTKLDSAMASNFSDIASLFTAVGKSTDSLVTYNNASSSTKPGNYEVNITQIATQGKTVGSGAVTFPLVIGAGNNTLDLAVNGVSASVTLTEATYNTAQQLVAELQSKINGVNALSSQNISVIVSENAGALTVTSINYGSTSSVSITGGTAKTELGLDGNTPTAGMNVAGSIGGLSATGSGQYLSAVDGDAKGLGILVSGGALGARGTLNYAHGYAYLLDKWATASLASDGILASRTDGIGRTITDIGKQRTLLENRLVGIEQRYRAQFTALDVMLSSMNTTSTYLTQQLDMLANQTRL